jgi:hypothetical protein
MSEFKDLSPSLREMFVRDEMRDAAKSSEWARRMLEGMPHPRLQRFRRIIADRALRSRWSTLELGLYSSMMCMVVTHQWVALGIVAALFVAVMVASIKYNYGESDD